MLATSNHHLTTQLTMHIDKQEGLQPYWDALGVKIALQVPDPSQKISPMNIEGSLPFKELKCDSKTWPEPMNPRFLSQVLMNVKVNGLEWNGNLLSKGEVTMVTETEKGNGNEVSMVTEKGSGNGVTMVTEKGDGHGVTMVTEKGNVYGVTMVAEKGNGYGVTMTPEKSNRNEVTMVAKRSGDNDVNMVAEKGSEIEGESLGERLVIADSSVICKEERMDTE